MNSKKVLVPVALSDGSLSSVVVATRLAQELSATMVLLHVTPAGRMVEEGEIMWQLRQLATRARLQVPVEYLTSEGRVADKIIEQSERVKAAAIVMSTHSASNWFSWLHRQTTREVLRRASCPIWLASPGSQRQPVTLAMHPGSPSVQVSTGSQNFLEPLRAFFRQVWPTS